MMRALGENKQVKGSVLFAVKLLISVGVLAFLLRRVDVHALEEHILAVNPVMFGAAVLLLAAQVVVLSRRWLQVMRVTGGTISELEAWRITMISLWFGLVLPSSAGSDAVRIWLLKRQDISWGAAVKGVLADRLTALIALVFMIAVGYPFLVMRTDNHPALLAIGALAAAGAAGTVVLCTLDKWPKRITNLKPVAALAEFGELLRLVMFRKPGRKRILGLAVLIHLTTVMVCVVLAMGIKAELTMADAFLLIPPVILLSAFPISISGWGVREGAMVAGLGLIGMASEKALTISLLLGLASSLIGVLGGLVWLFSLDRKALSPDDLNRAMEDALPTTQVQKS